MIWIKRTVECNELGYSMSIFQDSNKSVSTKFRLKLYSDCPSRILKNTQTFESV